MGKEAEFLEACKEGNVIKVEHLLVSTKTKKYAVPLFSKTASALLQSKDPHGSTALHLAALNGRKAVVYLLLDQGVDVTAVDENGCSALHLACWHGYADIASALISRDTRQETINALTKNYESPLHFAAQSGHSNIVASLLRNGAVVTLRNVKGETPLDLAAKFGRAEVVRCMLESNPNMVLNALVTDPKQGDAELPPPFSPLHLAAKNGKLEVVRLLLDAGFDLHFFTEEGTALHVAALYGKTDVVKLLLERGINADSRDFHGRTALELLEEHQLQKPVLLSHLQPNRDAWQHCSALITEHLERSSEASTVSKEVAAIYLNAVQRQCIEAPSPISPAKENAIWLPVPSNSQERINFEQGVERPKASKMESANGVTKPLSVLTNFHVPPPPPSTESGSICSTISLTATPTPSPSLTNTTTSSFSLLSPRFPPDCNPVTVKDTVNKVHAQPKNVDKSICTYQPMPLQYDNVPRPGVFPQTTYDNVPTNATGYDNAPPPNIHAWSHTCCQANGEQTQSMKGAAVNVETSRMEAQKEMSLVKGAQASPLLTGQVRQKSEESNQPSPRTNGVASVKFVDTPPETLYLPVEAKLYTRMTEQFTPAPAALVSITSTPVTHGTSAIVVYGPYDNVPVTDKQKCDPQKKSPDCAAIEADQELNSMQLIEQTIQVIEQSSRDMEENVEAIIRTPSRSSQLSTNPSSAAGSRPVTPPSPIKKPTKVPPPVSPKPKLVLSAMAPLAQPEFDELIASTDSGECSVSFPVGTPIASSDTERKSHKKSQHRSVSRQRLSKRSEEKSPECGALNNGTVTVVKRSCVDRAAQVDAGAVSSECDSASSCSGGSQCSLINSRTGSITNAGSAGSPACETEDSGNPVDEQDEWRKIDAIFQSCGTRMARLSVFDREIQPKFTTYLNGGRQNGGEHSNKAAESVEHWLNSIGMEKYKNAFLSNGFDRLEFLTVSLDGRTLRCIGVSRPDDIEIISTHLLALPRLTTGPAGSYRYVSDWLQAYGCQDYLGELVKNGYDTIGKIVSLDAGDLDRALGNVLLGHRLRLIWSLVNHNESRDRGKKMMEIRNANGQSLRIGSFPCEETTREKNTKFDTCTTFAAHYLGSTLIDDETGMEATRISMVKLKKSTKEITKVPQVALEISWQGVRVYDSATRRLLCEHAVENIHCVCQDERDMNCFAYITKDGARHFCHVFSVLTADIATDLILTLGKAFDVAYQKALHNSSF